MLQLNENYSNGNNIAVLGTANPSEMGKIFSYNGNNVTMRVRKGVVYVNLTEVAKAFPDKILLILLTRRKSVIIAKSFPNYKIVVWLIY